MYSIEEKIIQPHTFELIHTGICIELPKKTEAQIRSRSGLALKYGIAVLNSPGTIDEAYRGEIGVILINHSNEPFKVLSQMSIAQMIIKPIYDVDIQIVMELSESERGDRGFGSSGLIQEKAD